VRAGVNGLVASGIRNIILVSPYDLSLSGVYGVFGVADATTLKLASADSVAFRNQLATLYTPGVNTYFLDTLTLMNRVQASPSTYGFTHVTSADSCSASPSCLAAPVSVQKTFVFNDIIHTTSGFDALMSKYIANTINARDALSAPGDLGSGAGLAFSNSLLDRFDANGEPAFLVRRTHRHHCLPKLSLCPLRSNLTHHSRCLCRRLQRLSAAPADRRQMGQRFPI
jgi:hypothetical protein